tara:strand:- start:18139 stop:18966 length:828 start_codon:yes stop_codon:yes gene_type:complete
MTMETSEATIESPVNASDSLPGAGRPKISIQNADFYYEDFKALHDVSLEVPEKEVTAFIGPSGCGKSTLLRCINRMNDLVPGSRLDGKILLDGEDLYDPTIDVVEVRRKVGMVFQKPNPFPKSVYDNIVYAPKIHGDVSSKSECDDLVEECLKRAGLWEEVSDRLDLPGTALSGGQQQRLCIARTIAVQPEVVLMDEPCSALDPIATATIENLITELKETYTVVIVTHNMQQATRVSDRTAFFYLGKLIEHDTTNKIFTNPGEEKTEAYISGQFG